MPAGGMRDLGRERQQTFTGLLLGDVVQRNGI